tara:strand:+ start:4548 stop:4805 length:258 start_codon:yes stop_codon:yes gene_type:complete
MAKKEKFYTVWKGSRPGIYTSWKDCKAAISNYKGAQYKSFPTFEEAKKAYNGNYDDYKGKKNTSSSLSKEQISKIGDPKLQFHFG